MEQSQTVPGNGQERGPGWAPVFVSSGLVGMCMPQHARWSLEERLQIVKKLMALLAPNQ